jgi:hypothetical protein
VVGKLAVVEPVLPVVRGPDEPPVGLVVVAGRVVLAPGQRAEAHVALLHQRPRGHPRALDAEVHVRDQAQLHVGAVRCRGGLVVGLARVGPLRARAPVVEDRIAVELDLNLAVDAPDRAQEDVVGVVVGGRAPVGV